MGRRYEAYGKGGRRGCFLIDDPGPEAGKCLESRQQDLASVMQASRRETVTGAACDVVSRLCSTGELAVVDEAASGES
jgi:hypothetical protein